VASLLRKEQNMEFPPFQSRQEVVIHAPLQAVWEFNQDLTNIAAYHPRVKRVDLISGKSQNYSTKSLKAKLFTLIAKRKMARDSQNTLNAIKRTLEKNTE
jgi:uncharacterized membrane protein